MTGGTLFIFIPVDKQRIVLRHPSKSILRSVVKKLREPFLEEAVDLHYFSEGNGNSIESCLDISYRWCNKDQFDRL